MTESESESEREIERESERERENERVECEASLKKGTFCQFVNIVMIR